MVSYSLRWRMRNHQRWILTTLLGILVLTFFIRLPFFATSLTPEHGFDWHETWWEPNFLPSSFRIPPSRLSQHRIDLVEKPIHGAWTANTSRLSLPELKELIRDTNGYYVRDWSVGLGWNNLRYIIEASLLHARLLNRVLVLPSYVYARSCEYSMEVCAQYGLFVDRSEVVGWDGWNGAPLSTLAWQIPIQVMLDLPHLRTVHPVILAPEFFELHDLDSSYESLAGDWNRGTYESKTFPPIYVIPNGEYDPTGVIRVDTIQPLPQIDTIDSHIDHVFNNSIGDAQVLSWENAVDALRTGGDWDIGTDEKVEKLINQGGWVITYTFEGAAGMDYSKTVVDPIRQIVRRSRVRGFLEDYSKIKEEVLLLEGETHLGRKPGAVRFTTRSRRDAFADLVLTSVRPVAPVRYLAKSLAKRMQQRCGGRAWMAAHMRRGDFAIVGWAMEKTLEAHITRIKGRLEEGREILSQIASESSGKIALSDAYVPQSLLPREGDPFFLATDERNATGQDYLRNNSAVLIYDLLTIEDRRTFGWPLLFTDILALVEQSLAVESAYFYGHALSSFPGGVLNMRVAHGANPRTTKVD